MTAPTTAVRRSSPRSAAAAPRPPQRHRLRSAAIALAAVLVVAAAVWLVGWSPVLAVRAVRVVPAPGEAAISPAVAATVVTAADVPTGVPLARVDADAVRARVLALPRVADVEVRRGWPNDLVLAVTERVPVAVAAVPPAVPAGGTAAGAASGAPSGAPAGTPAAIAGGAAAPAAASAAAAWTLVDATGVTFDRLSTRPPKLPLVAAPPAALPAAAAVIAALPPRVASLVTEVDATTPDDVTLTLDNGSSVRWGSAENSELKGRVLVALLPRRAALIDVSAPLLPTTSRERGPLPTPTSRPAASPSGGAVSSPAPTTAAAGGAPAGPPAAPATPATPAPSSR